MKGLWVKKRHPSYMVQLWRKNQQTKNGLRTNDPRLHSMGNLVKIASNQKILFVGLTIDTTDEIKETMLDLMVEENERINNQ